MRFVISRADAVVALSKSEAEFQQLSLIHIYIKLLYVDRRVVAERTDLTTPSREATLENRFGGELNFPPKRFILSVDAANDSNSHGLTPIKA